MSMNPQYMISADQGVAGAPGFCNCFTDDRASALEMFENLKACGTFKRAILMDMGPPPMIITSYGMPEGEKHLPGMQKFIEKEEPCLKLVKN